MERTLSLDDLVGGIWKLQNASMGRTDSEAAFQEFLKRIPSATNLAAAASQYEPQLQQAQQLLAGGGASTALPFSGGIPESTNGNSMPRVPSLDLLRQLVLQNQLGQGHSQGMVKSEVPPAAPLSSGGGHVPPMSMAPNIEPNSLSALGASVSGLTAAAAAAAAAANPNLLVNPAAAAAAAALQLQNLGPMRLSSSSAPERDSMDKSESRRQRRMLSNRESARRSRKRKQEHMQTLEQQIDELKEINKEKAAVAEHAERRCQSLEDENTRLKEENERLRDELRFLRAELTERKERNGYYRRERSPADDERDAKQQQQFSSKRRRMSETADATDSAVVVDAAAAVADGVVDRAGSCSSRSHSKQIGLQADGPPSVSGSQQDPAAAN
eukprot:GHRR01002962.1.p1 GENE.GHRR01002962.1~~GHRR01002962.1.p1  ORF type:complete len:385 (+),score=147.10 GHRR01002962.1:290-1444(+)